MYLKRSTDYIDSKYIWVHGSNSLGVFFVAEIPFLAFLPYTGKKRGVAKWNPAHVNPKLKLHMHTSFRSVSPRVFLEKKPFLAFLLTMVTIFRNF